MFSGNAGNGRLAEGGEQPRMASFSIAVLH